MNSYDDLRQKYPRLIKSDFDFECGIGWLGILDCYFGEVDTLLPADVPWSNRQIKEKFGTLRLYCEALWPGEKPTAIFAIDILNTGDSFRRDGKYAEIERQLTWARWRAEGRSAHTCEACGKRGRLVLSGGYYHTACDEHLEGGEPVGSGVGGILQSEGKRYRFDIERDDFVEIEGEADDE